MTHFFQSLRQHYGDMRLQSKITLVLMLIVTVPVLMLGIFFYTRLYDMVVSYTISQEQDASTKTSPLIEDTVQKVLDAHEEVLSLPFYHTVFESSISSFDELVSSEDAAAFSQQIKHIIDGNLITSIQIYADLPNREDVLFLHDNTGSIFRPLNTVRGTYWHGIFQGTNAIELFCPPFYLGKREQAENGDIAYIISETIDYQGEEISCYVAVYFSAASLEEILVNNLKLDGSVSYIMNERNALVASSDTSLSGIYWLDYDAIRDSVMSSNNFIERTIVDQKVYAGFYSIAQTQWFMVTVLPSAPLIEQSNSIMIQYILFYLAFLVLAFLLAYFLAHSVTNRISSVIEQMRLVRQGPPVPMEAPVYHDEVGDLIDTYNYMTWTMAQLMADQAQAAEDLRIAEFNSLQSQINPHFLYNTMDMINWLAQQGRTSEVSDTVQSLSRFYKLTLSRKQSISTIAQEEEHVSIYIRLQNMRFHDSIAFISDIPDELMEYQIPKLTLQPIIENAILHGILEKDTKEGTIVLTCWMEDDDIVILVSDDGVGIPPEKLPTLLTGNGTSSSGGTNIAVYNTHRRLQILYGKEYGLSYSSVFGKGTDVQLRIPARKGTEKVYVHTAGAYADNSALPLATVSDTKNDLAAETVSSETFLSYSQKLTQNLYNIQLLHRIFTKLPKNENLYILTHQVEEDYPKHKHDYFELNYVCQGALYNVVDGTEVYMETGDLVLLNQKAVHSLRYHQPDTLLINFCLKPEIFHRTLKGFCEDRNPLASFLRGKSPNHKNYMFFSLRNSFHAQSIIASIIQEYADNGFHQSFSLDAYFLLLFACLTETGKNQHSDSHDTALMLHASRLNKALELMADPNLNIYQIAKSCGYQDANEFFDVFQRQFHTTPDEYRKNFL